MASPVWLVAALPVYWVWLGIYRLYLSPLTKFPGPKLAALTSWYCTYFDLYVGGQYTFEVEEMHRKYGPIVRIMPDVLHVNDPRFVDKLYPQSPAIRRERAWSFLSHFITHTSSLGTRDHDLHRRRRATISRFFSQANVRRLTPVINDVLGSLLRRFQGFAEDGQVFNIHSAMQAATKDVIQSYAFGDGPRCLDMDDMSANFLELISLGKNTHFSVHFNWIASIFFNLPPAVLTFLDPKAKAFSDFVNGLIASIEQIRKTQDQVPQRTTIFHEILTSSIPESEKATLRLLDEAIVMTLAGTDTTAMTLTCLAYYILSDPAIFARLRAELDEAIPDASQAPDPVKLDDLPYLNALIEETLRFHPTAAHRQDRTAPDEDIVFQYPDSDAPDLLIPRGTSIGMTARMINRHPAWYGADADVFRPERYLENPKLIRSRLLTFSKGGRQCIGINLAYQELQTFTAGIFRTYGLYDPGRKDQGGPTLELIDTTVDDITMYADYLTPGYRPGSKGCQVKVRGG